MKTEITELRGYQAMGAILSIDLANHEKFKVGPAYYGIDHKAGALLVEPMNANPFVLIDESADPSPATASIPIVKRIEWIPKQGSGTDFLRARIEARLFFDNLEARPRPEATTGELVIQPLRAAIMPKAGPSQRCDRANHDALVEEASRREGFSP